MSSSLSGRTYECRVDKFAMASPGDMSGLEALFRSKAILPRDIIGVVAKTEGNGKVNDFSRPFALGRFRALIAGAARWSERELDRHVSFIMSGGCEGIIAPHAVIFSRRATASSQVTQGKRLAMACARTRTIKPEEIGTPAQSLLVAAAVSKAMREALIDNDSDVHFAFVKGPLLTAEKIGDATRRKKATITNSADASIVYSNGASALGVALGVGDIRRGKVTQDTICRDATVYTSRSGASAGIELDHCEILLFGNSRRTRSAFVSGHHELADLIDASGIREALASVGGAAPLCAFAKGHIPVDSRVRGWRTTLLSDSDLGTRPARAVLGAVVASITGDPAVYVSAGLGFHEGPPGGGSLAVIGRVA